MMKLTSIATVAVLAAGASQAATFDFSDLTADTLATTSTSDGLTVAISGVGVTNPTVGAAVYDTDVLGADPDLTSPFSLAGDPSVSRSFGNAIIVQENPAGAAGLIADDDGRGGVLTFDFGAALVELGVVSLLDAIAGTSVTLFDGLNEVVMTTTISADTGNNARNNLFTTLDFGGAVGSFFEVDFNGRSGAVGEFDAVSVVPVPATLPLLLVGLGGLGFMSRRRKTVA